MFTAEQLGKLLFLAGVTFFYATIFVVTRSPRTFWTAAAIGVCLFFSLLVAAHH
jgi:hypothetical protein